MNNQEKSKENIVFDYLKAYNSFNVESMMKDMSPDIIFENVSGNEISMRLEGLDAFRQQAEEAKRLFSERIQRVVGVAETENRMEVEIEFSAVLAVDFSNGMKQGDTLELKGKSIFEIEGGKIRKLTDIS